MGLGQLIGGAVDSAKDAAAAGWDAAVDAATDVKQAVTQHVDGGAKAEPPPSQTPAGVNLAKPASQKQAGHVGAKAQAMAKTKTAPTAQTQSQDQQRVQAQIQTRIGEVKHFARQYDQRAATKGDLQNLADAVREKFTGHRDHQFRNIGNTLEALAGLQQRLASGHIEAPAAQAELDTVVARYERTKSEVDEAQTRHAEIGVTLHREVRNGAVSLAGILTKPFGGGAPGGAAAGSAIDVVTELTNELGTARVAQLAGNNILRAGGNVQLGLLAAGVQAIREYRDSVQNKPTPASPQSTLAPLAPKLDTSGSLGGVLVRAAGGAEVSAAQWRKGLFGSAGDLINGAAGGLGVKYAQNAQRALLLKSAGHAPRRHALALAAAQSTAKTSAAQNMAQASVDTVDTLTGQAPRDGRTRGQKALQDAQSKVTRLPIDVAVGTVNSYFGVAAQLDHVLDVPLQYTLDTAGNALPRWIDDGHFSADDLTSSLAGAVHGTVPNMAQRLPQGKARTVHEAPADGQASASAKGVHDRTETTDAAAAREMQEAQGTSAQQPSQTNDVGAVGVPAPEVMENADVPSEQSTQSDAKPTQTEAQPGSDDRAAEEAVSADPVAAQEAQQRLEKVLAAQLALAGQELPSPQQVVPGATGHWQNKLQERRGHAQPDENALHDKARELQLSMALEDRFTGQDISWMTKQEAIAHVRSRPTSETFIWRNAETETELWMRGEQGAPSRQPDAGNANAAAPQPVQAEPTAATQSTPAAAAAPVIVRPARKPLMTRFADTVSLLPKGISAAWTNTITSGTSALDFQFNRAIERPLRTLGNAPGVRPVGDGLNVLSRSYRSAGRFVQNNPLVTGSFGHYQALTRQARYYPLHLQAKLQRELDLKVTAGAVRFYESATQRIDALRTQTRSIGEQIGQLQQQRDGAVAANDALTVLDIDQHLRGAIAQLKSTAGQAAKPLREIERSLDRQIDEGTSMLRQQEQLRNVRQRELDRALEADHQVNTPRVLEARHRLHEARRPFGLAKTVRDTKRTVESLLAEAPGVERDVRLQQARRAYEEAKTKLSKYTLAGNDSRLDMVIDRDDGLIQQLETLKRQRAVVEAQLRDLPIGEAGAAADPVRAAADVQARLDDIHAQLQGTSQAAQRKYDAKQSAQLIVDKSARVDRLAVDATAAGSDLSGFVADVGFLHSTAKDIFDGKGKGRIESLSNVAKMENARRQLDTVQAEQGQWSERADALGQDLRQAVAERRPRQQIDALRRAHNDASFKSAAVQKRAAWCEQLLSLEQRAAEPRSIEVRLHDLQAKIEISVRALRKMQARHEQVQARLFERRDEAAARREGAVVDSKPWMEATRELDKIERKIAANDYALDRAVGIHSRTEALLEPAQRALATARETAGITPGKIGRNTLRLGGVAATAATFHTLAELAAGQVEPDEAADLQPLLQQMNLPGGELALPLDDIRPMLGVKGVHALDTAQGTVFAWRVKGTFADLIVVAQPTPQARGVLMSALMNGGKAGNASPSIQKGTSGLYLTFDSQRFALAGVTLSSVFHPNPNSTALNWWQTVKIEVGAFGVATRANTAATHPKTGKKVPMLQTVFSNSIKAPVKFDNIKLPLNVPFIGDVLQMPDGAGLSVTVKNSLGLGQLSLVYDPELGVGQLSDRTVSMEFNHDGKRMMFDRIPGTQPFGTYGTAIRVEPNYYAQNDSRNDGDWLMENTKLAKDTFDIATAKPAAKWLTGKVQLGIDNAKFWFSERRDEARRDSGDTIDSARERPSRAEDPSRSERRSFGLPQFPQQAEPVGPNFRSLELSEVEQTIDGQKRVVGFVGTGPVEVDPSGNIVTARGKEYALLEPDGTPITNPDRARARAQELIRWGAATDLTYAQADKLQADREAFRKELDELTVRLPSQTRLEPKDRPEPAVESWWRAVREWPQSLRDLFRSDRRR